MRWLSRASRAASLPQRRSPGRRLRRRLALAGGVMAIAAGLIGAGAWAARSGRIEAVASVAGTHLAALAAHAGFAVDHVAVAGRRRTGRRAILAALGVHLGSPILAVDLGAAKTRLEALAWIRTAEVERRLPDTIFVRLVERRPLAFWQRNGKLALIDDEGKVVPTGRFDDFGSLIVLVGDDVPHQAAALLAMLAAEPTLYPQVAAAVHVGGRRWNVKLDNGIEVALPEEDPERAWHHLAVLDQKDRILERAIVAVDLRLPDRLVLRLPPAPPKTTKKTKGGKAT